MENNLGIRHLALKVKNFDLCFVFYTEILGMSIDWKPDDNNVYLTNGSDNLALHYDSNVSCNLYITDSDGPKCKRKTPTQDTALYVLGFTENDFNKYGNTIFKIIPMYFG